ncbi:MULTISPECIES: exopolysaccharide biosynthesis GT4 family glycosyltransferase EpsE [unclassified Sphingopyxis]|jgi:glycosyltransferase involved in cell wall biosynthesis|uniref:exopolysaccharide biosynthesis GT4 family glycosyltransferase EpsE n=1 Tax=unclassified Sphingopyxis TaxID=2614943 RepID=UPI0025D797C2|nr:MULTISPECIES: exopolysaccharide biosynthesis GT4 family glycosyltransferase EpsE [unclassified Sphingopyxis]
MKVGYLVPEFPGQTHIFFWREIKRLEQMGINVDIISTRPPPVSIRSHTWSKEAEARTTYLANSGKISITASLAAALIRSNFARWPNCVQSIACSHVSIKERFQLVGMAAFGAKLARIATNRAWDHIHVHSCGNAANIAAFASMLSGVPYSLTLHGALTDYGSNQSEKWRNAAFGIVITRGLFDQVRKELGAAIAAKTVIAPMGVNLDKFKRVSPYRPWKGEGVARIYSVGRLNEGKGHADLILAVHLLKRRGINVHLTIAGQDEQGGSGYQETLRKLIDDLNLTNNVALVGAVSEAAIVEGLLSSHVFALATRHEALGVAIMEAMALEMPVVVNSVGGVGELVEHQKDGILAEAGNPESMANSIAEVLTDSFLAQRLAGASREKIRSNFQDTRSAEMLARQAASAAQLPQ